MVFFVCFWFFVSVSPPKKKEKKGRERKARARNKRWHFKLWLILTWERGRKAERELFVCPYLL